MTHPRIDSEGFDFRVAGRGFVWSYPERRPAARGRSGPTLPSSSGTTTMPATWHGSDLGPNCYLVPVKAVVRRAEGLEVGDTVAVRLVVDRVRHRSSTIEGVANPVLAVRGGSGTTGAAF